MWIHHTISLRRQCGLTGLPRSTHYYASGRASAFNVQIMRLVDEQFEDAVLRLAQDEAHLRRHGYAS